jgi:hypothetical protein
MRRQRLLTGFLLLLAAAFVRHASDCGLLGDWAAHGLHTLLGSYGATLLAVTLAGTAVSVAMPRVIGQIIVATTKLAVDSTRTLATRVLAKVRKARPSTVTRVPARTRRPRPAAPTVLARVPIPREGELRGALRNLGFSQRDVERVLPQLDSGSGIEGMLRQALLLLRAAA